MIAFPTARLDRLTRLLAACLPGIASVACGGNRPIVEGPGASAHYQTASPADASQALSRTFESLRRIQITATYKIHTFAPSSAPREAEVGAPDLLRTAIDTTTLLRERAATAVVLSRRGGNVALLTADHFLEFPDTIVQLFEEESDGAGAPTRPNGSRRVESISIKTHQANWVRGAVLDPFEVLARDSVRDLALVGVREPELPRAGPLAGLPLEERARQVPFLHLSAGDSDRLGWGSFVYVLGYPQGYPMVTRGIISSPRNRTVGSFLVDGLWNPGMSGGLIIAVRGDGQGLEWVGIARSAASTTEVRLTPEEGARPLDGVRRPYDGQIFLEEYRRIDYGITLSVPISDIRAFLDERRFGLVQQGFVLPRL